LTFFSFNQDSNRLKYNPENNQVENSTLYSDNKKSLKRFYKSIYVPQTHNKFSGKITIVNKKEQEIVFLDSLKVTFHKDSKDFNEIFTSGLITVEMLLISENNSVGINRIEELTSILKTKKTQRQFKIEFYLDNWANLHYIFIELTNDNSNRKTDWESFLKDAKVTFVSKCIIQI